jgi:hypothetical protein
MTKGKETPEISLSHEAIPMGGQSPQRRAMEGGLWHEHDELAVRIANRYCDDSSMDTEIDDISMRGCKK